VTCTYPHCDCPVLFPEGHRPSSIETGCMRTVICTYPDCDCAVSFPEGYRPSMATECPNPRDPRVPKRVVSHRVTQKKKRKPVAKDPIYAEARRVHALLLRCEGLKSREIGARLGVTGARALQLIHSASLKLRSAMRRCHFQVRS
jgi:hypothetical protein